MSSAAQSVPRERWSYGVTLPPPGRPAPTASLCGSRSRGLGGEDRPSPGPWPLAMPDPSPGSRRLGDSPRWRRRLCCSVCPDPRAGGTPYKLRSLAVGSSLCAPKPNKFPSDLMLLTASVRTRLPEATRNRQSSPGQTRRAAAPPRPPAGRTRAREGQRQAPQLLPFSPRFLRGNLMSPPQ